jgi:coenzyme F420-reducing hydrogenase gamma subunit
VSQFDIYGSSTSRYLGDGSSPDPDEQVDYTTKAIALQQGVIKQGAYIGMVTCTVSCPVTGLAKETARVAAEAALAFLEQHIADIRLAMESGDAADAPVERSKYEH